MTTSPPAWPPASQPTNIVIQPNHHRRDIRSRTGSQAGLGLSVGITQRGVGVINLMLLVAQETRYQRMRRELDRNLDKATRMIDSIR